MFTRFVLHNKVLMWLAMAGKMALSIRFGGVCLFNPLPLPSGERLYLLTGKVRSKMRRKSCCVALRAGAASVTTSIKVRIGQGNEIADPAICDPKTTSRLVAPRMKGDY